METDRLSCHNTASSRKLRYTSPHNEKVDGFGFSKERLSGAFHQHLNSQANNAVRKFGNSSSATDANSVKSSDITELTKLRPRGIGVTSSLYTSETNNLQPSDVVYLERDIMPSDTLQSFALLYGCSVNDLKRANNLISEQDFFALRRLKIPVKKHGLLTEPEEEIKRRPVATTSLISFDAGPSFSNNPSSATLGIHRSTNDVYHLPDEDDNFDESRENVNLLSPKTSDGMVHKESIIDSNDTSKFLKSVDKEIRKTIKMNNRIGIEKNEILQEVVSSLGSVGYRPLPLPKSKTKECDGANWGIKWSTLLIVCIVVLIVFFVFVGLVLPTLKPAKSSDHS